MALDDFSREVRVTALVFWLTTDSVMIVADTLALTTNGRPFKYVTKVLPLPHLSAALCGTGDMNIVFDWHSTIQSSVIASSFLYLNTIGPEQLQRIAAKHAPLSVGSMTTYHFGYDPDRTTFRGFALRSTNQFSVEELAHGVGIKPYGEELGPGLLARLNSSPMEAIVDVIEEQKRRDEALPPAQRLGIGGGYTLSR